MAHDSSQRCHGAMARLGPVPGNICSSTTAERPGHAAKWLKLALVCELLLDIPGLACRVALCRIALRRAHDCPPPRAAANCIVPHRTAPQRTSHSHRHRLRHRHTAQHNAVPALVRPRCCVSATSCHLCSHPDPLRLPRVSRVHKRGALLRNQPPPLSGPLPSLPPSPSLVGRYLVAVHLKHATNRLLFICANRACRAA